MGIMVHIPSLLWVMQDLYYQQCGGRGVVTCLRGFAVACLGKGGRDLRPTSLEERLGLRA